jgi:hypothetical protein
VHIRMKCPHCDGRFDMSYKLEKINTAFQPQVQYGVTPEQRIVNHLEVHGPACASDLQKILKMNGTMIADTTNTLVQKGVLNRWKQRTLGRSRVMFSLASTTKQNVVDPCCQPIDMAKPQVEGHF